MKFVSLSQLLGCPPLWVQLWSFHSSGFIVLLVGIKKKKKKKKEGRRDIKGKKEGIEQERRKERKVLIE